VVLTGNELYSVVVEFKGTQESYTADGKILNRDEIPSLYHGIPKVIAPPEPERLPLFDVDDQVLVSNEIDGDWICRHFANRNNGKMHCWAHGKTSFTTSISVEWDFWRLPEDDENHDRKLSDSLTPEELWAKLDVCTTREDELALLTKWV
jgi:hypothetical protein